MKKAQLVAVLLILFVAGSTMVAQNTPFRGKATDDSGAVLIGAVVTVKQGTKVVTQTKTTNQGTFEIPLAPGQYSVEIAAEDFETLVQAVRVTANMPQTTFSLKLGQVKTEVTVQENTNLISLDPDSNLTATVLDQDFIQQLPDDPDELTAYLTDLAGPRANAAGGVDFIIDGFSNGTLPPKDQILQIRINNNPFSTEFMRPGFGRIEIVTKPGTGQYHGNIQFNYRNAALDANNILLADPATGLAVPKPPYQRRFYTGNISGPIIKNRLTASANFQREGDNPSSALRAIDPITGLTEGGYITSPSVRDNYNTRGQWGLTSSQRHILNFNLQYQTRSSTNAGVGGFGIIGSPTGQTTYDGFPLDNAYGTSSKGEEIQLRETEIISSTLIHELRYEWDHNSSLTTPDVTTGPTISISGSSQFGSANNQNESRNTNYQFANALSYTGKMLSLKTGIQAEHFNDFQSTLAGFNGAFTFGCFTPTSTCSTALSTNTPSLFTITTGIPQIQVYQWTLGAFLQTDWKLGKKWVVSGGARYQIQTDLSDHNDIDPRGGFAFQINNSTVLRGGFGTFHQILPIGTVNNLIQEDGQHQLQTIIVNPTFGPLNPITPAQAAALATSSEIYVRDPNLRTPYTINTGLSLEKTFKSGLALTGSFDDIKSVHLYRGRDINAPLITPTCTLGLANGTTITSGCVRPNPTTGIIDQLESSADARFDSLTLGFRDHIGGLNIFGSYTYSENYGDARGAFGLPSNNYNLASDWGLSGQQVKNRIQTSINYRFKYGLLVNSNITANSGRPYTQTLNSPGPDGSFNQRLPGVPVGSFIGPGSVNVALNLNKTFVLREGKAVAPRPNQGQGGGGGRGGGGFGGGPGGPGGGGPGGGGGGRGGGGGGFGGAQLGPGGISMTTFLNTTNIINHTNLSTPSGELNTPYYGISINKGAARIIELGLRFNF